LHSRKPSEAKSLTFLLQPICHLTGRFGEGWLSSLIGDIASKKNKNKNED